MYSKDKITKCKEIKTQGDFILNNQPFYVFFAAKDSSQSASVVASAKLARSNEFAEIPFTLNTWNPISVLVLRISGEMLQNYRIFYGIE